PKLKTLDLLGSGFTDYTVEIFALKPARKQLLQLFWTALDEQRLAAPVLSRKGGRRNGTEQVDQFPSGNGRSIFAKLALLSLIHQGRLVIIQIRIVLFAGSRSHLFETLSGISAMELDRVAGRQWRLILANRLRFRQSRNRRSC